MTLLTRLLLTCLGLILYCSLSLRAALPASDAFTGSGALSASWTQQRTTPALVRDTGVVKGDTGSTYIAAFWNADSFSANHCSQVTFIAGSVGSAFIGPSVRAQQTGDANWDAYTFITDGTTGAGHSAIEEIANGTQVGSTGLTMTATNGDLLKLCAEGTTITAYKNGSSVGSISDATLTAGSAGVASYSNAASADDWVGTDIPAAGGGLLLLGVGR